MSVKKRDTERTAQQYLDQRVKAVFKNSYTSIVAVVRMVWEKGQRVLRLIEEATGIRYPPTDFETFEALPAS